MTVMLSASEMKQADADAIASGTPSRTLMERAARAALELFLTEFDTSSPLFVCGNGNNGGDGLAMARFFCELFGSTKVCYLGPVDTYGRPDTARMSEECARQFSLLPAGVRVCCELELQGISSVVDGIFGIGLARPIEGRIADAITTINRSGLPVLALDIPSGVCADTGNIMGVALRAMHTVSTSAYKYGQFLFPGTLCCGKVTVADIGIPVPNAKGVLLDKADLYTLPRRPERAHKGTFGRVLVIGGSVAMSGAGYLAAKAAYRAGAGLVEIFAPAENRIIYQTQLPEALLTLYDPAALDTALLDTAIARADAIAIGMGLGRSALTQALVAHVLTTACVPLVVDADALNEIAATPSLMRLLQLYAAPKCITPHLGEMSRLCGKSASEISMNLPSVATEAAALFGGWVVLKDARTVICDGEHLFLNRYGNNGMASGGCGDVLAGIIAAFFASGNEQAPVHGVLTHALAGDAAKEKRGTHGLMASDIIDALQQVLP